MEIPRGQILAVTGDQQLLADRRGARGFRRSLRARNTSNLGVDILSMKVSNAEEIANPEFFRQQVYSFENTYTSKIQPLHFSPCEAWR